MNDKERFEHILRHYQELCDEFKVYKAENQINRNSLVLKKAIYMDLFQIGEHVNKLSDEVKKSIGGRDIRGIIDIRNIIGHGYQQVDPDIVHDTILQDCPRLIAKLKELFE